MILIGQYDSSYVRRVAIALRLYDLPFEHRPWSVFGDADRIRRFNPLVRVPTLVLSNGTALIETLAILDHLDHLAPIERVLLPRTEPARHNALRICALASGLTDAQVSLFYEKRLHEQVSRLLAERRSRQIRDTLGALEQERAAIASPFWFGDAFGHADIAMAAAWRHLIEAHPEIVEPGAYPILRGHAAQMEAMPVFRAISQPFIAPA